MFTFENVSINVHFRLIRQEYFLGSPGSSSVVKILPTSRCHECRVDVIITSSVLL